MKNQIRKIKQSKKQIQNLYINDMLTSRILAYKNIIEKIIDDVPESINKIDTIGNDSLSENIIEKIDDYMTTFSSKFGGLSLVKKVSSFINRKVNTKNKAEYKNFIKSNKQLHKQLLNKSKDIGISFEDMVDNENMQDFLKNKITENVEKIKSMDEKVFSDIKNVVLQNISGNKSKATLKEQLLELGAKNKKKAIGIAKDQTNKLIEDINNHRNQTLGAKKFMWLHSGKATVSQGGTSRDRHAQYDQQVFEYSKGAGTDGILPGEEINCECTAIAIFED